MENHTAKLISSETCQILTREDNLDRNKTEPTGAGKTSPSNYIPDNFLDNLLLQAAPFSGEICPASIVTFAFT